MRGWTTPDLKKIKNLIKTFRSKTSFSYLQYMYVYIYMYMYICICIYVYVYMYMYICICKKAHDFRALSNCIFNDYP